jgi:GH15 family glucan-1,4-alpha-glucosidase
MLPTRYRLDGAPEDDSWPNFQLDGYGTWLWGLAQHVRMTGDVGLVDRLNDCVSLTLRYISLCWRMPNYDCWEEFGDRLHPATLACLYGGLTAARNLVKQDEAEKATRLAGDIRDYILRNGVLDRGAFGRRFAKSVGNSSIDASLLWLAVPFAAVDPVDPIMICTVDEIERHLYHRGVHRYPEDTYYGGGEWPLLACWLGWYYCLTGRPSLAAPILDWVEGCADERGELPEQVSDHVNDPEYVGVWVERWGPVARPLLWSHAMYLVLSHEVAELDGRDTDASALRLVSRG